MNLYLLVALLGLAALAAGSPTEVQVVEAAEAFKAAETFEAAETFAAEIPAGATAEQRNQILINILVSQAIAYLRRIINNGSLIFGIPPLDPLVLEHFHIKVPAGLINLDLEIVKGLATGFGGFVVNRSRLQLSDMTFDLDITVPEIVIAADEYALVGDLVSAIPLYGKGEAKFTMKNFRMGALFHLKQSDDEKSIIIDRIEKASFNIPSFKSELTGVIGGGDIDGIVNAIVEDVIIESANRFNGAISYLVTRGLSVVLNPILGSLDTWRYISRWV